MFLSAGCSLLRAEGFICNFDVLYGGPWIRIGSGSGSVLGLKFLK
jgi:hypothetical protein